MDGVFTVLQRCKADCAAHRRERSKNNSCVAAHVLLQDEHVLFYGIALAVEAAESCTAKLSLLGQTPQRLVMTDG